MQYIFKRILFSTLFLTVQLGCPGSEQSKKQRSLKLNVSAPSLVPSGGNPTTPSSQETEEIPEEIKDKDSEKPEEPKEEKPESDENPSDKDLPEESAEATVNEEEEGKEGLDKEKAEAEKLESVPIPSAKEVKIDLKVSKQDDSENVSESSVADRITNQEISQKDKTALTLCQQAAIEKFDTMVHGPGYTTIKAWLKRQEKTIHGYECKLNGFLKNDSVKKLHKQAMNEIQAIKLKWYEPILAIQHMEQLKEKIDNIEGLVGIAESEFNSLADATGNIIETFCRDGSLEKLNKGLKQKEQKIEQYLQQIEQAITNPPKSFFPHFKKSSK
ncbi:hypothetical protein [Cardinium endosymbiont of Philonthus spinipes]|uniref:hypothetical protein n=1 Tax=Cardinium endosymbiont of Philonthus spinipes TaxID=3077941 RepID=UPI00313C82FA